MKNIIFILSFLLASGFSFAGNYVVFKRDADGSKIGFDGVYHNVSKEQIEGHLKSRGPSYYASYFSSQYVLVFKYEWRGKWVYNYYPYQSKAEAERVIRDRRKYEATFPNHGKYEYQGIFGGD